MHMGSAYLCNTSTTCVSNLNWQLVAAVSALVGGGYCQAIQEGLRRLSQMPELVMTLQTVSCMIRDLMGAGWQHAGA